MGFASRRISPWVLCIIVWPLTLFAQIEDDEFRSGLIGQYSDHADHSFARRDATVSIASGRGEVDWRLAGDSLRVHWAGFLMSQAVGEYRLHAYGAGSVRITLDGEPVLQAETKMPEWSVSDAIPLQFAFHPLKVAYDRKDTEGGLRLFWSGPQFQLEPIGPQYFFHDPTQTPDASLEQGELIVRAMRCAACHHIPGEAQPADAASLAHVAGNMRFDWLVDWLANAPPEQQSVLRRMPHFSLAKS
ncbi:MAG: hypothetical protein ABI614_26190, partial [Planctomycetota bacterium]